MFETAASLLAANGCWLTPSGEQLFALVFYALLAGANLALVHVFAARTRSRSLRDLEPGRCYDPVLKMLADEQGDWYVEKVLSHELGKVLSHNTRDLDVRSLSDDESDGSTPEDSEEWEESEEESGTTTTTSSEDSDLSSDEEGARRGTKRRTRKHPGRRLPPGIEPKTEGFFEPAGDVPTPAGRAPGRKKPPPRPSRLPPRAGLWPATAYVPAWPPTAGTGGEPSEWGDGPPPPPPVAGKNSPR